MSSKSIISDELKELLRKHKLWMLNDPNGSRAYLYEANLIGTNINYPIACPENGSFIGF